MYIRLDPTSRRFRVPGPALTRLGGADRPIPDISGLPFRFPIRKLLGFARCFPSGTCLPIVKGKPENKHQEYWDPFNSGNPLLKTSGKYRDLNLSPHFKVGELARSGGTRFEVARIDPTLVECLERIRMAVGRPVRVTSGYRPWGYNVRLYEKRDEDPTLSQHCSGRAADIKVRGMSGVELAKVAIDACGCDIGVGIGMGSDGHGVHIDVRGEWARWGYGPRKPVYVKKIDAYHRQRC